eukprot:CAMPEP_0172750314 /NCGR_PEP_ID=MMETSP1074-20121228/149307_1 /TAXON_ID=2916 /ORGANISM="Ceratium fusus, Strain PA161109" /LENGTH=72 /DNA_ID=CAMNT_0013582431 /DNA_START=727 /DNA_END=945 /DNA_ORIENTATION=+
MIIPSMTISYQRHSHGRNSHSDVHPGSQHMAQQRGLAIPCANAATRAGGCHRLPRNPKWQHTSTEQAQILDI